MRCLVCRTRGIVDDLRSARVRRLLPPGRQWPSYVKSIAVGKDGGIHTPGRLRQGDKVESDLIRIPMPRGGPRG